MFVHSTLATSVIALWLLVFRVASFGQEVQLTHVKKLSYTADSLPRIVHPTPAQIKINRDLALLDRNSHDEVRECRGRAESGDTMFYERRVTVLSRGPRFLSFLFLEQMDCGGVHPYDDAFTLTYDLHEGKQVNWAPLLTRIAVEDDHVGLPHEVGVPLIGLTSPVLDRLFSAGWKNDEQQPECDDLVSPSSEYRTVFQLAPAANRQGLSLLPANLGSMQSHCAYPVVLGKSGMDSLGIPPAIQAELLIQP